MKPRRFDFYLGIPEPSWLNHNDRVPKCATAARFDRIRSGNRMDSKTNREWPVTTVDDYIIDSGAYTALTSGKMNSTWWDDPETYGSKILTFLDNSGRPPAFCAQQDLPCEPDALAATGWTVAEHQKIGLENYLFLTEAFPMVPWIPVLQGWEPEEYLIHERMFHDAGVDLASLHRVGIGSICKRGHVPEIAAVIGQFAGRGYRLHGFGIKTTALPVIGHLLRSADSMSWSVEARYARTDTRDGDCQHDGKCNNCYGYAKRWRRRVLDRVSPAPAGPRPKGVAARLRRGDIVEAAQLGFTGADRLVVTASARPVDVPGRVGIGVQNAAGPAVTHQGYLHATTRVDVVGRDPEGDRNPNADNYPLRGVEQLVDLDLAAKSLTTTTEDTMPTTTDKPAAADGGGGVSPRIRINSLINWHRRGTVRVPHDLQGFKAGQVVDAYVCCLCGGVELTLYSWRINHGCCDSVAPYCSLTSAAGRTAGMAVHWSPLKSDLLAMGQLGGLDVGDVVALPGERKPLLIKKINVKASEPYKAILVDRHGNTIETSGREVHTLDLLARARRYPFFPAHSRGAHCFMPLAGNLEECAQCGGGNYPYHDPAPHGPGRFVPVVAPPGVQPVADPGNHEGFRDLVSKGVLIDMAGYPLNFVNCLCNRGKVSGTTCPIDVPCTDCGATNGKKCMRPSEHEAADYHRVRKDAADEDMCRREAAGDLTVPAPWPDKTTTTKEAATVTAATKTPTKKTPAKKTTAAAAATKGIRWVNYKGADAVPGDQLKPGEEIRCPVSGCDRRAKIRRDGKVSSHKMFGAQTCHAYGEKIPATVTVDVLSRRTAAAAATASAEQATLDGMTDLFAAMLAGQTTETAVAATTEPDTTPLPQIYDAELMVAPPGREKRQPGGALRVRVDELARLRDESTQRQREINATPLAERKHTNEQDWRAWVIASEGERIPPRHVFSLTQRDQPGCRGDDGTTMWRLQSLLDGERGSTAGQYDLWGSSVVTIVPMGTGGFGPGMFSVDERAEVQTRHDGLWMRVVKITYGGVFVKGQKPIVCWSDIYAYRKWGNEIHGRPAEMALVHGTHNPEKNSGFDGGDHQFVAMFTGSLRCRVCLDSIRWEGHTGILNADFQGFEEIRQDLHRPTNTWQARVDRAQWLDRYVRGLPLVRFDRDSDVLWNWVCPLGNLRSVDAPNCGGMHVGFRTKRAAKASWLRHCAEQHPGEKSRDSWGRSWKPAWDDKEFPTEPGIVFDINRYAKHRRPTDPVPAPVAVEVVVPRTDPSWERQIAVFEAEGRGMALSKRKDGRELLTIEFPEGQPAAASFRAALKDAGLSYNDIDMIRRQVVQTSLADLLSRTHDPKLVNRSTGTLRDPERMMGHLDKAGVEQLDTLPRAAKDETAIIRGVILHRGSLNATVVGWFAGRRESNSWWNTDFNKFKKDPQVEFILLAPNTWENDYDREAAAQPKAKPVTVEVDTLPGLDDFMAAMAGLPAPVAPVAVGDRVSWTNQTVQTVTTTITDGMIGEKGVDVGWDIVIPFESLRPAEPEEEDTGPAKSELEEAMDALAGITTAVVVPALPASTVRPVTPAYITLPEGWTGPERCPLPADSIVVLARQIYWNSDRRPEPDHTLHIVNWGLPEQGFCWATVVDTKAEKDGFQPYEVPDIEGRDDARYGTPADATCTKCRWAFDNKTSREALPVRVLDGIKKDRKQARDAKRSEPGPDAAAGQEMLLTDVPLYSYIEVPGRDGMETRSGYLTVLPRVHTAGWGTDDTRTGKPYLKYELGVGPTTVGMYSPMYLKVTVLPAPDDAPVLPDPLVTRPMCVADLRPGDVVDKGGLNQKARDGEILVLGRPRLVSKTEVRIAIRVGGRETSARIGWKNWTQLTDAAPYTRGDEAPLAVESKLADRDHRALQQELHKIVAEHVPGHDSRELLLWAAGAARLRTGFYFWKSWNSGDKPEKWLTLTEGGSGVGGGRWMLYDKAGFCIYPSYPGGKSKKELRKDPLAISGRWSEVLAFMDKVPAQVRQLIEDLMADREACSPGQGYTAEHITAAPRDAESTAERYYRTEVESDLHKAGMEAWLSVRPA